MELRINKNCLEIKNTNDWRVFASLPDEIEGYFILPNHYIVVQTDQGSGKVDDRNIFLFDIHGNLLWQIEKAESLPDPFWPNRPNPYSGFKWENEKLICFTQGGLNYEADLSSGKIKYLDFTK